MLLSPNPVPDIGKDFWWALLADATLSTIGGILYIRALRFGDISLTIPLMGFSPLFLAIASPLILNEFPAKPQLIAHIPHPQLSHPKETDVFSTAVSGNEVDSKNFGEIAVEYEKRIQVDSLIVADSALYTESNIKLMSSLKWLTRVPLTIKLAKSLVMSLAESEFVKSEKSGYSYAQRKITYGDIEQRWLVVQSQDRKKSDLKKLSKKIKTALINTQAKLKKLAQEKFACAADARKFCYSSQKLAVITTDI